MAVGNLQQDCIRDTVSDPTALLNTDGGVQETRPTGDKSQCCMPQLYCIASVRTDDEGYSACTSVTYGSLTASRALLQLVPILASHQDSHAQTLSPCLSVSFGSTDRCAHAQLDRSAHTILGGVGLVRHVCNTGV